MTMYTNNMQWFARSFFLCVLLFAPFSAHAAYLYLDPSEALYGVGDTFIMSVRIDNEEECLNAMQVSVQYPVDVLKAVDFSRGNSILTLWAEEPKIDIEKGIVSFAGGVPGGYCGRIHGDPALSNTLGRIIFMVIDDAHSAPIVITDASRAYVNDGLGTQAAIKTGSATIMTTAQPTVPENPWIAEVQSDETSPDAFEIEVQSTRGIFSGRYYAVFATQDKQSGIDHFEIRENGAWKTITSPYALRDQTLSDIRIRAIDKAGNERLGIYKEGSAPPRQWTLWDFAPFVAVLLVFLVIIGMGLHRRAAHVENPPTP